MCDLTRRALLRGTAAAGSLSLTSLAAQTAIDESRVNQVDTVATDVYFHQGDIAHKGHCNNGWIVFKDYVLVIDANYPSGANEMLKMSLLPFIERVVSGLPVAGSTV